MGVEMAASADSQLPLLRDAVVPGLVKALGHAMTVQPGQSAVFVLAPASDPAKVAAAKFQDLMNSVTAGAH